MKKCGATTAEATELTTNRQQTGSSGASKQFDGKKATKKEVRYWVFGLTFLFWQRGQGGRRQGGRDSLTVAYSTGKSLNWNKLTVIAVACQHTQLQILAHTQILRHRYRYVRSRYHLRCSHWGSVFISHSYVCDSVSEYLCACLLCVSHSLFAFLRFPSAAPAERRRKADTTKLNNMIKAKFMTQEWQKRQAAGGGGGV